MNDVEKGVKKIVKKLFKNMRQKFVEKNNFHSFPKIFTNFSNIFQLKSTWFYTRKNTYLYLKNKEFYTIST
jgi:hypothetical protein